MTNAPDQPARDGGNSPAGAGAARPGATGAGATVGTPPSNTGRGGTMGQQGGAMGQQGGTMGEQGGTTRQGATAGQQVPRQAQPYQAQPYEAGYQETGPRGMALGFTLLASVLMMVSGVWAFFEGLAAIIRGSWFVVAPHYVYDMSAVGWGWIHLILGVLIAAAGVALLRDMMWARITGVVLAALITIANFVFIPYYPVWSIVLISLNVFVIWALLTPRRA